MMRIIGSIACLFISGLIWGQSHVIQDSFQDYGQEIFAWDSISMKEGFGYQPSTGQHHLFIDEDGVNSSTIPEVSNCEEIILDFPSPIDQSCLPYNHSGSVSVSELGAANFNYPFSAEGFGIDFFPSLGLNYNSNGRNGLFGKGGSLQGLMAITRGNFNVNLDGNSGNAEGSFEDALYLNGGRLIKKNGNLFVPQNVDYSQIEVIEKDGDDYKEFVWKQKSGLKVFFGSKIEHRIKNAEGIIVSFLASKIISSKGDVVDFEYREFCGTTQIYEIHFGKNERGGRNHIASFKFFYKENGHSEIFYFNKGRLENCVLIEHIKLNVLGETAKDWTFGYSSQGSDSFLSKIELKDAAGRKFNPIELNHFCGEPIITKKDVDIGYSSPENRQVYFEDFNGDGLDDIVELRIGWLGTHLGLTYYENEGNHEFLKEPEVLIDYGNGSRGFKVLGDFNGDTFLDFIFLGVHYAGTEENPKFSLASYQYFKGKKLGGFTAGFPTHYPEELYKLDRDGTTLNQFIAKGDLNHDGNDDLLINVNVDNNSSSVYFIDDMEGFHFSPSNKTNIYWETYGHNSKNLDYFDIDADAEIDLFFEDGNQLKRGEITYDDGIIGIKQEPFQGPNFDVVHRYQGDFNGDGNMDFLWSNSINKQESFTLSLGKGNGSFENLNISLKSPFGKYLDSFILNQQFKEFEFDVLSGDFNGDGKTDLVGVNEYSPTFQRASLAVLFSEGTSFDQKIIGINFVPLEEENFSIWNWLVGNVDGLPGDEIGIRKPKTGLIQWVSFNNLKGGKISQIADGLKNKWSFEYSEERNLIAAMDEIHTLAGYRKVANIVEVEKMQTTSRWGDFKEHEYGFGSLWTHVSKGVLGNSLMRTFIYDAEGTKESEKYVNKTLNLTLNTFLPENILLYNKKVLNGEIVSYTNWHYENTPDRQKLLLLKERGTEDKLSKSERVESWAKSDYDSYGNVLKQTVVNSNNLGSITTVVENESFTEIGGSHVPNFPTLVTTTVTRDSEIPFTTKQKYIIENGQIARIISNYEDEDFETEQSIEYNNFGSVTKKTVKPVSEIEARISYHVEYDDQGRYVRKQFDDQGTLIQEVLAVNSVFAIPTSILDIRTNLRTEFVIDGLGSVVSTNFDDRIITSSERKWNVGSGESGIQNFGRRMFTISSEETGKGKSNAWIDQFNRTLKFSSQEKVNGEFVWKNVAKEFDPNNLWSKESETYFGNTIPSDQIFETSFDEAGRVVASESSAGTTTYDYDEEKTTIITPNQTITQKTGPAGNVVYSSDGTGIVETSYYSSGQPKNVKVGDDIVSEMEFETNGLQKNLSDLNAGQTNYTYNGFGQIRTQTDAQGQVLITDYDTRGRPYTIQRDNGTVEYAYYETGPYKDELKSIIAPDYKMEYIEYDNEFRSLEIKTTIKSKVFVEHFTYDPIFGRLTSKTYDNGVVLVYQYDDDDGHLKAIKAGNTTLVEDVVRNERGQVTSYTLGNDKISSRTYDSKGFPESFITPGVQDYRMEFNASSGNLEYREDRTHLVGGEYLKETFTYDKDRLSTWKTVTGSLNSMSYASSGNINLKSDVSDQSYTYDATRIHALKEISNGKPAVDQKYHSIVYNSMQSPTTITGSGAGDVIQYKYGASDQRIWSEEKNGGSTTERYYMGAYELSVYDGEEEGVLTVTFPGIGPVAFLVNNGNDIAINYTYTDHLGTVTKVTDNEGAVIDEQAFDPWGRRRNPNNWNLDETPPSKRWMYRGFTGHEMLENYGLIHMNGRLYDPVLARMLSPDNYVQNPGSSQSYNRYSYVLNNPLKYTDPSGEIVWFAPIIVGGVIGGTIGGIRAYNNSNITIAGGILRGATVGAFGGALSMVGGGTFVANVAWGSGQGAITGGLDAAFWGNDIEKGILYGAASGAAFASVTSGIESYGNYRNGYGFRTNEGVLRHYQKQGDVGKLSSFFKERYGINATVEHSSAVDQWNKSNPNDFRDGVADIENNRILLAKETLRDVNTLKQTVVHEYAHLRLDFPISGDLLINPISGEIQNSTLKRDFVSNDLFKGDGPNGWLNEIGNAGALKISHKAIGQNFWGHYYNLGGSFWNSMPKRYTYQVVIQNYR